MGIVESVKEVSASWPPALTSVAAAVGPAAKTRFESRFADFEAFVVECERSSKVLLTGLRRIPAAGRKATADDLRFGIEMLERYERQIAEEYGRRIRTIEQTRRRFRRTDPDALRELAPLTDRLEDATVLLLEAYRDARWALIAKLARAAPEDVGPTFDDPSELKRYLVARKR